jgi:branched-chain amino acid aminotransferase
MYRADFAGGNWLDGALQPYAPIPIDPAATILHYAQQAFEGLKAYRVNQPEAALFRPEMNYRRLVSSSHRLCMPTVRPPTCPAATSRHHYWPRRTASSGASINRYG